MLGFGRWGMTAREMPPHLVFDRGVNNTWLLVGVAILGDCELDDVFPYQRSRDWYQLHPDETLQDDEENDADEEARKGWTAGQGKAYDFSTGGAKDRHEAPSPYDQ